MRATGSAEASSKSKLAVRLAAHEGAKEKAFADKQAAVRPLETIHNAKKVHHG
jgi:hypothetical protein